MEQTPHTHTCTLNKNNQKSIFNYVCMYLVQYFSVHMVGRKAGTNRPSVYQVLRSRTYPLNVRASPAARFQSLIAPWAWHSLQPLGLPRRADRHISRIKSDLWPGAKPYKCVSPTKPHLSRTFPANLFLKLYFGPLEISYFITRVEMLLLIHWAHYGCFKLNWIGFFGKCMTFPVQRRFQCIPSKSRRDLHVADDNKRRVGGGLHNNLSWMG